MSEVGRAALALPERNWPMDDPLVFFLGTHVFSWLGKVAVPLFVSYRTLAPRKKLRRALAPWGGDSAGFTELSLYGRWTIPAPVFVEEVRRWVREIGMLAFVPAQDWMCEPQVIAGLVRRRKPKAKRPPRIDLHRWLEWARAAGPVMAPAVAEAERLGDKAEVIFHGTGLSVEEHQRRTIASYEELLGLAPEVPWAPVLQGWTLEDYLRHVAMYVERGHDLWSLPVVGVGTMCRRQRTDEAATIIHRLASLRRGDVGLSGGRNGMRLHGFGFKLEGLRKAAGALVSADSLAWSYGARYKPPLPGHEARHKNCANCVEYALGWRDNVLATIRTDRRQAFQMRLV